MNKVRALAFRILSQAAVVGLVGATATCVISCADENDPKTWAKRLDDPAQRTPSIKRLNEMFDSAMSNATPKDNRDDPKVKGVVDDSIEPLTKVYTTQSLDEKTRKDLIKLIAEMGDPRGGPAFAKAFADYEPGKNDEDVKFSAQGTTRLATANKLTDKGLIDALWDCFAKFQPSKAKSINLVKDLQSAVKTVKDQSYAQKAVALLAAPVTDPKNPDQGMDQIQFWQLTAVQLIGDAKYGPGIKSLVTVLLTPTKVDLSASVRNALQKMPKESEPVLIQALKGEGDFAKLAEGYPDRAFVPVVAEPLAYISRAAGRDAILDVLAKETNPSNVVMLASYLTYFRPVEAKTLKAYQDAYGKVPGNVAVTYMRGENGNSILAGSASAFFDSSLTDWILKSAAAAKGEAADAMPASAYPAAIKIMTPEQTGAVEAGVNKIPGQATEKEMFKAAKAVVDKCKKDSACYLGVLDTPVPTAPVAAKYGHVKAVYMAAMNPAADTKAKLLEKLGTVKDASVRLALILAVDHLSPQGDAAAADKMEKIVEADRAANTNVATDEMYRVAMKLRSRIP